MSNNIGIEAGPEVGVSDIEIATRLGQIATLCAEFVGKNQDYYLEQGKQSFHMSLEIVESGPEAAQIIELLTYNAALSAYIVEILSLVAAQNAFIEGINHGQPH